MSTRLAAVFAHPDDDTFGVAGTVALHADDPGFRFVLIHATSGEAGMISDPSLATRETLGAVREDEDRRSWITLGRTPDRHEWLRYADHGLADLPLHTLVERVAAILREERPDVVITFGEDGITGHPDHITIGRAATAAFHALRAEGLEGFRRLIHVALPQSMLDRWNQQLIAQGREPMDPTQLYQPRGVPDASVGFSVDTSAVAQRVVDALGDHRTQASDFDSLLSDEERLDAAAHAYGIVAWPQWEPGDDVVTDAFEGLD